jgi:hypothetical protein
MEGCLRVLALLLPLSAFADGANNEWFSTTRALSMGNAGIASAEDAATAVFYNPAALSRGKKFSAEIFNPQFDIGLNSPGSASDVTTRLSLEKMRPLLEQNPRKATYTGAAIFPNFTAQNFSFGILLKGEGGAYHDGDALYYKSRYLVIPTMGIAMNTFSGSFRIGAAVRAIQITDNDKTVPGLASASSATVGYRKDPAEGLGIGLDAGALLSVPWAALPTLAFVARNIGDTSFSGSAPYSLGNGDITRRQKMGMTYDAGFSISPRFGRKSQVVLAADYRDIMGETQINRKRRVNLGLELGFDKIFFFRVGLSRGYFTAGIGLNSRFGSLDLGTYAEELDAIGWRKVEDRRLSFRLGRRF